MVRLGNRLAGQIRSPQKVGIQPLPVRFLGGDLVLQLAVFNDAPFAYR